MAFLDWRGSLADDVVGLLGSKSSRNLPECVQSAKAARPCCLQPHPVRQMPAFCPVLFRKSMCVTFSRHRITKHSSDHSSAGIFPLAASMQTFVSRKSFGRVTSLIDQG